MNESYNNTTSLPTTVTTKAPTVQHDVAYSTIVVILGAFIIVFGFIGNSLICYAIYRAKSLRTMANVLLVNLAVADFLQCFVTTPLRIYIVMTTENLETTNSGVICAVLVFTEQFGTYVEMVTLVSISVERYNAVAHPFQKAQQRRRVYVSVVFSWVFALIAALLIMVTFSGEVVHCGYTGLGNYPADQYGLYAVVSIGCVCLTAIIGSYSMIIYTVFKHVKTVSANLNQGENDSKKNTNKLKSFLMPSNAGSINKIAVKRKRYGRIKIAPVNDNANTSVAGKTMLTSICIASVSSKVSAGVPAVNTDMKMTGVAANDHGTAPVENQETKPRRLKYTPKSRVKKSGDIAGVNTVTVPVGGSTGGIDNNVKQNAIKEDSTIPLSTIKKRFDNPGKAKQDGGHTRPIHGKYTRRSNNTKDIEQNSTQPIVTETRRESTGNNTLPIRNGLITDKLKPESEIQRRHTLTPVEELSSVHIGELFRNSAIPQYGATSEQLSNVNTPLRDVSSKHTSVIINCKDEGTRDNDQKYFNQVNCTSVPEETAHNTSGNNDVLVCVEITDTEPERIKDASIEGAAIKEQSQLSTHASTGSSDVKTTAQTDATYAGSQEAMHVENKIIGMDATSTNNVDAIKLNKIAPDTVHNESTSQISDKPADISGQTANKPETLPPDKDSIVIKRETISDAGVSVSGPVVEVVAENGDVTLAKASKDSSLYGSVCVMNNTNKEKGKRRVEIKTAKRTAVVILIFVLLWFPFSVYLAIKEIKCQGRCPPDDSIQSYTILLWTVFTLTCVANPVLYGFLNRQMKAELKRIFKAWRKLCKRKES